MAPNDRQALALASPAPAWLGVGRARHALTLAALASAALALGCARSPARRELWFYDATNLADSAAVARLETVWRRAARVGYARVLLADSKLERLDMMDARYFETVRRLRALADSIGLGIVPAVFPVGRSSPLLAHDPNLAEGLPVRDALFEVRGGRAELVPDPPVALGPIPDHRDPALSIRDGIASARHPIGRGRFGFDVRVHPNRCYHVHVRLRTTGFAGEPEVRITSARKAVAFERAIAVDSTMGWTAHDVVFNSLDRRRVAVTFGTWHPARGTIEWRDWTIEEVGPVNVLRRKGAPLEVRGLEEGADFDSIVDPFLGVTPWAGQYEAWHAPPPIRVRRPDGTQLRISWTHAAIVYGQVTCCISEPRVIELLGEQARRVRALFGSTPLMMMHDEIRAIGRDASCRARRATPGGLLADHMRRCVALCPGCSLYVWSDMFDPRHNAVKDYALVDGDLAGSWEGLPAEVAIVNWNAAHRLASLRYFAARGHRQVIAGYYDGRPEAVEAWLRDADRVKGVDGVMYTTWRGRYGDLEAFASACRRHEAAAGAP